VSPDCAVCGEPTTVSDACPHCGESCCRGHRTPDAHDCPGTDAGRTAGWRPDLDGTDAGTALGGGHRGEDSPSLLRPGIGLAVLTLLLAAAALGAAGYAGPADGFLDVDATESRVEEHTNDERRAAGAGGVAHDRELAAVARAHSRDMRDRGFVDHVDPDGDGPEDRLRAAGLDCSPGENVYQTPRGALASSERALADHVVRSWLESPGHRETLLRDRYTRQGVGVAVGEEAVYVTQLFC
jgi:uncharacterized protein YkwD